MRGAGQIRELARVALPDVGVITNIAPVHLELVGTIEDVAAAKAELIEELTDGTAVVPADEPLLDRHVRRHRGRVVTFGTPDADVHVVDEERRGESTHVLLDAFGHRARMDFSFTGGHYLHDALAAVAAFVELGYRLDQAAEGAAQVAFSDLRGALSALPGGGLLLNDAYNANPVAMKAAVDHLVAIADGRPDGGGPRRHVRARPRRRAPTTAPSASTAPPRGVRLVAVGDLARDYLTGAPGERWFATVDECLAALPERRPAGQRRPRQGLAPHAHGARGRGARRRGRRLVLRAMGASVVAMVLVLVIGPAFIRWLRVNEFGQNIREDGPEGHKTKEGTPTMGGVLIWFAVLIPYLVFSRFSVASLTVFIAAMGNAMHRLHRRLDQDRAQALAGALGALQAPAAVAALAVHRVRGAALRRRHDRGGRALHLVPARARHDRLLRAHLPDARRLLQRREPHRRPRRPRGRRLRHRARRPGRHRLHHRAQHQRPGHHRPHGHRRVRRRRGARVPLVQHLPGRRLHGRHRLARPRRRHRRHGRDDAHRARAASSSAACS